jgi:molybdopterin-dependent oxidoreductase alpha subunit
VTRKAPTSTAGGWGSIAATARHLIRETGLVRGGRTLLQMNQPAGFDCPGCAWPEPADRGRFEFCENGAKAIAEEATRKRATPADFAARSIAELRALSDFELGQLGRITHPMVLRAGSDRYQPIEWADAFGLCAEVLGGLESPDQALFYTSGRTSNEAAFLYQLFGRRLGTNNFPDCSNMCHESSGVGLTEVIGVGKGTVSLEDFDRADAVFIIGQNPGTNHPRMLSTLRDAARRGARIVAINPLREPGLVRFAHPQSVRDLAVGGVPLASELLQVRVGGDLALIKGIIKAVLEAEERRPGEVLDGEFIAAHTTGFEAFAAAVRAEPWERLVEGSGIEREAIERAAAVYVEADRVIACWAMGITQHKHAVATIQEIVNLLLLRGNLGKPGAGACPVRGHSNVQGDRTVGITERPAAAFLEALGVRFGFEPPRRPGLDTVGAIEAMLAGEARFFMSMGGNFYSATPDTAAVGRALEGCALTVHVSTKVNRAHLYPGQRSLILPCLGRTEIDEQAGGPQMVSVEDSMSMVHASRGSLSPASAELRSEPWIVAELAMAALPGGGGIEWHELVANYDRIREAIEAVVPGFEDYNQRVRGERGFRLPNGARDLDFAGCGGAARFTVHAVPDLGLPPGRLRLMTMRSHDQFNTTIYGLDDRYRGVIGERRVVFLNRDDMHALGIDEQERVDITSEWEDGERSVAGFVAIAHDIPRGCAAAYFPEANPLVPRGSVADKSRTPTSKSIVVRIAPTAARAPSF